MEEKSHDPLAELKKAIISQKSAALPDVPPQPDLMPLHQALVEYDRYVSQIVITILGGGRDVPDFGKLGELDSLFTQAAVEPDPALLAQYRRYRERLDRMLNLAQQVASTRSFWPG